MISASRSVLPTPSTMAWWVLDSMAHRPAGQALDHPDLPQRPGAVELLRHDPAHQLAQVVVAARGGQGGVPQVVLELKVAVVDPHRAAEVEGDEADHLAVPGHERQLVGRASPVTSANGRAGPSKMATEPMCMWLTASSTWRNDVSRGLIRSLTATPLVLDAPWWPNLRSAAAERARSRGPSLAAEHRREPVPHVVEGGAAPPGPSGPRPWR